MESLKRKNMNEIQNDGKRIKENQLDKGEYILRYTIKQLIEIGNNKIKKIDERFFKKLH